MKVRSSWPTLAATAGLLLLPACGTRTVDAVLPAPDAGVLAATCRDILMQNPAAPDGSYIIDPDGPGPALPVQVHCDMTGGGFTRIGLFDFGSPPTVFSRNELSTCGGFGMVLGGYRLFGEADVVTLELPLAGVVHSELRVRYDLIVIDSWDGEEAFLRIDEVEAFRVRCDKTNPATCNQRNDECGWTGEARLDGVVPIDVRVTHARPAVRLDFGAVLDQSRGDESWAIDNLAILVR